MITHNNDRSIADRIVRIEDGKIVVKGGGNYELSFENDTSAVIKN